MRHLPHSDSTSRFTGLRVAVTGGTSGLGLAFVRELLGRGARVAFVARTPGRVEHVARMHPGAHGIVGDISEKEDIHAIAVQIVGELGGLDVLVNNASDVGPTREGRGAVVLNVSSDAALNPYSRWGAYGASKAALRHLSAIWDAELAAEGVRFLSIDPGDMDTPLHAAAVPDADPATLKRPEAAARELADAIAAALPRPVVAACHEAGALCEGVAP